MSRSNMNEQHPNRMPQPLVRSSTSVPSHSRRFDESWVEVSSQPSSSSLSSIGDEIVTTGLLVGGPYVRRRRHTANARSLTQQQSTVHAAGTSSQEEYDSSESDEDGVAPSSRGNMGGSPLEELADDDDSGADSDDGDNATALGMRVSDRPPVFRPQPNAFSHPPSHLRRQSTDSVMPPHPHSGFTRPSFSQRSQTRVQRGAPSFMSPTAREDNDAALRASLTTLLSCAAAARGLPKSKEETEAQRLASAGIGPSNQPMDLRFIPESELMQETSRTQPPTASPVRKRNSPSRSPSRTDADVDSSRRSDSAGRAPRAAKKKKTATAVAEEATFSPTLLTWAVSAGVVVLISVVGFGAGYVIGREVGRQEVLSASVAGGSLNDTTSCGREVLRTSSGGLKRFKWSAVGRSIVA